MRPKINTQTELNFQPSDLAITQAYYAKYEAISFILDENPKILDLVHADLRAALEAEAEAASRRGSDNFEFTSDNVLRIALCQIIESCSLRQIVIRIDDSSFLRCFVRIYNRGMMDFTTLCRLKNQIKAKTWKKINRLLARAAARSGAISGEDVRLDTTAIETNIHWPTDSSLLWDTYRVLARYIERIRQIDPEVVGERRLLLKKVKRLQAKISRKIAKTKKADVLKPLYSDLIRLVEGICQWSDTIGQSIEIGAASRRYGPPTEAELTFLEQEMSDFCALGRRVIDQARRRVIHGEQVPNEEKIFSIFESHTELIKRGKAGRPIEFGHMVQIQQVSEKFITDYDVFERKPVEHELLEPAIESHKKLFGDYPGRVSADKGYYKNRDQIAQLNQKVELVSIAKKGRRTEEEEQRESDPAFRHAQRFRAGVEGTISYLKRVLGLARCMNKGWEHYVATVGAAVFTHNLLILARC